MTVARASSRPRRVDRRASVLRLSLVTATRGNPMSIERIYIAGKTGEPQISRTTAVAGAGSADHTSAPERTRPEHHLVEARRSKPSVRKPVAASTRRPRRNLDEAYAEDLVAGNSRWERALRGVEL
jgi:hypothetical protein